MITFIRQVLRVSIFDDGSVDGLQFCRQSLLSACEKGDIHLQGPDLHYTPICNGKGDLKNLCIIEKFISNALGG